MLISLYLAQSKYFKIRIKCFSPLSRDVSENFVFLCRQTINRMHTLFHTVHAMSDMNSIYQFKDI